MGVMACNRRGCTRIMCDRYNEKCGYICEGCFKRMREQLGELATPALIRDFMDTDASKDGDDEPSSLEALFPRTETFGVSEIKF